MWVFSLLTSPYIGCGHVCANAFDNSITPSINGRQYFSASLAAGCSKLRMSMRRTFSAPSAAAVNTHLTSSDYDFAQTSQVIQTPTNAFQAQVSFDWVSQLVTETSPEVNTNPTGVTDRQVMARHLKTSQRENFYVSQCTAVSLFVGQKISDMTTV